MSNKTNGCGYHDDCETCDITYDVPYCHIMQDNSKTEQEIMEQKRQDAIMDLDKRRKK